MLKIKEETYQKLVDLIGSMFHDIDEYGKHFKDCEACHAKDLLKEIEENNKEEICDLTKYNLLERAMDVGMYCKSTVNPDGAVIPRTEFQEGWNQCQLKQNEQECKLFEWYHKVDKKYRKSIDLLLDHELLYPILKETGEIEILLFMNDVFCFASDCEKIKIEDLEICYELYSKFGYDGLVAFVAERRKTSPIENFGEKYSEAVRYIKEKNE